MSLLNNPFVQNLLKNQLSTLSGSAGAWIAAHGFAAGYAPAQITGALFCIGAVALQFVENHVASTPPKA